MSRRYPPDEADCPECEETAWRGEFPVLDGDCLNCLSCGVELFWWVDTSSSPSDDVDGWARLKVRRG